MKTTKVLLLAGLLTAGGFTRACGGNDDSATNQGDSGLGDSSVADSPPDVNAPETGQDSATPDAGGNPPMPAIGATQIDRMGRPAVNTALNHAFDPNAATRGPAKDAYNGSSDPTTWKATYAAELAKNLAILDSFDNNCGNQILYTAPAAATSYSVLGQTLADDRLYLNTAGATCAQYLAVEANATGILLNTDCGGRTLAYDVIDTTYSVTAIGALTGVGDGVPSDADPLATTFPFLASPH